MLDSILLICVSLTFHKENTKKLSLVVLFATKEFMAKFILSQIFGNACLFPILPIEPNNNNATISLTCAYMKNLFLINKELKNH